MAENLSRRSGSTANKNDRGLLIEYALTPNPLILPFSFNPSTITRTRSVTVNTGGSPGARGGFSFATPDETPRASQGVTINAESFSFKILLDATDRLNEGDELAKTFGVQPEIDAIRTMLEPKPSGGQGLADIAAVSQQAQPAFSTHEIASVLIFKWGAQILPVFMTNAQIEAQLFLPGTVYPYRAEATLTLQVIESDNPIYQFEKRRQQIAAQAYSGVAASDLAKNIFDL